MLIPATTIEREAPLILLPIESEPNPTKISLSQLVDFYCPDDLFPDRRQVRRAIQYIHDWLLPRDVSYDYAVSIDSLLPLLKGGSLSSPGRTLRSILNDELATLDPQRNEDSFLWKMTDGCGLKLDLSVEDNCHLHNTRENISRWLGEFKLHFAPIDPTDLGLPSKETHVFQMFNNEDKIAVSTIGSGSAEITEKAPYIIIQDHLTPLGVRYFTLKLAVDTDSDSPAIQGFSKYRTLFEMKFSEKDSLSPLDGDNRINFDKGQIRWITKGEEPYAVIPEDLLRTFRGQMTAECDDLLALADPRDTFDLVLTAGRMMYLAALVEGDSEQEVISDQVAREFRDVFIRLTAQTTGQKGSSPFEQAFYQLANRGEDFTEEINLFTIMMAHAYLRNREAFIRNYHALGLNKIIPIPYNTLHHATSIRDLLTLLYPISHPIRTENRPTPEELRIYARSMRFCQTLAEENIMASEEPFVCLVLKNGELVTLGYPSSKRDRNPYAHGVIKALESAAEDLKDSDLTGCEVIMPFEPDPIDAVAILNRPGIKRVIWSLPHPYMKGSGLEILESSIPGRNGHGPQIIRGLLQKETKAVFAKDLYIGKEHLPLVQANYSQGGAERYAQATRALIAQYGPLERMTIEKLIGGDLAGKKVLDAGCGPGDDCAWLDAKGANIYGLDAFKDFIEIARRDHPQLEDRFHQANITNLPFSDSSFDIILGKYVLNELTNDDIVRAYQQFQRCLKQGGKLVLFIHGPISQMFFSGIEGDRDAFKDYFKPRLVRVPVYDDVTIRELTHTHESIINPLLKNFRLTSFLERQDIQRMHPHMNIPEMLVLMAEKI